MFTLPKLPYSHDALEPHIDKRTMEIHHGAHHAAYVNNLNKALEGLPAALSGMAIEQLMRNLSEIPEPQRTAVRNNGGGHFNHSLFWTVIGPGKGGKPQGDLAGAIDKTFGSFEKFKETFEAASMGRFGSGWAWLSVKDGKLLIHSTPNQDNPLMDGSGVPILGLDVWEHAYYLKYQNKRADYVKAFWNLVDWDEVARRYREAVRR
jgi:Fe-Mn family superoxide dismutase